MLLVLIAFVLMFVGLPTLPVMAQADDDIKNTGISLGGRANYFNPADGDGSWYGGAQLRAHLGPIFALEGSIDYRKTDFGSGTDIHTYPVLVSALVYLFPGRVAPFLLGGVGWYFTHTEVSGGGSDSDDSRFGAHAGGGLEIYLNRYWSIDATYRYVWVEEVESTNAPPLQKEFDDNGHMITAALNYHF
jgi:opacity protein-like surface antigen